MPTNKMPMEALLDVAEDAAYMENDRLNTTSIMQIFARMQKEIAPSVPSHTIHATTINSAYRLAQLLYLHYAKKSDAGPVHSNLAAPHTQREPPGDSPERPVPSALRSGSSPSTASSRSPLCRTCQGAPPSTTSPIRHLLRQFINNLAQDTSPEILEPLSWAILRHHLHLLAGQFATENRDYDAMLAMATAFTLRDPSKTNPAPETPPSP